MGAWAAIRRFFGFVDHTAMPYEPSSMTFLNIDTDALRAEFRLETRGMRRGEIEEPKTDSTNLDEVEHEILNFIGKEFKKSIEQYIINMRAFAARLGHLDLERSVVEIKNEAKKTVADFNVQAAKSVGHLENLKTELREAKSDLNNFQQDNNRKLAASSKSVPWIAVSFLVMLILFVCETYFNGTMLGQGLIGGLSAGMGYAMAFSFVNIVLGVLAGHFGFRATHHVKNSAQVAGWLAIVLWLLLVIIFNLVVGHFRDGLSGNDWENVRRIALNTFLNHPFLLNSIESYILWLFGILVSVLIAIDTFKLDDPYPDYGRITRHYKNAVQDLLYAKEQIQEAMQEWRDAAVEKMYNSRARAGQWRAEYSQILASMRALEQAFIAHVSHLESSANRLLEWYRGDNKRARRTPPPAHFTNTFRFEKPQPPAVHIPKVLTEQAVTNLVVEATDALENAVTQLNQKYQYHITKITGIDQN